MKDLASGSVLDNQKTDRMDGRLTLCPTEVCLVQGKLLTVKY